MCVSFINKLVDFIFSILILMRFYKKKVCLVFGFLLCYYVPKRFVDLLMDLINMSNPLQGCIIKG